MRQNLFRLTQPTISPQKKSGKKAKQTPPEKCVTCKKDIKQDGVECQWCRKWEHRACAGLSQSEYNMLTNSSNKIMFFCTFCFSKVPFALKVESETTVKSQELEARLGTVEEKLTEILQGLKTQVDNRQEIVHKDDSNDSFMHLTTSIVAEQKEKEKRQLNLILHKVEESAEEEPPNRKKDDIQKVTSLFTEYIGVETTITNATRIGKKGTKPRLLKVGISNLQDKISILRSKKKLRNEGNPENIRSIFISADLTPLEQKKNKLLREKLNTLNKDSNKYMLKNGEIVPRRT